jgi:hypothetical protein
MGGQRKILKQGAADRGEYRQAAGADAQKGRLEGGHHHDSG